MPPLRRLDVVATATSRARSDALRDSSGFGEARGGGGAVARMERCRRRAVGPEVGQIWARIERGREGGEIEGLKNSEGGEGSSSIRERVSNDGCGAMLDRDEARNVFFKNLACAGGYNDQLRSGNRMTSGVDDLFCKLRSLALFRDR